MSFKKRHIYRSARPVAGNTKVMWFSITAGLVFLIVMLMVLRSLGHGDEEAPGTGAHLERYRHPVRLIAAHPVRCVARAQVLQRPCVRVR